ncbi:MAG TPA: Gfo/Idh/MocA family oxidoreductase [Baekduia sp.]
MSAAAAPWPDPAWLAPRAIPDPAPGVAIAGFGAIAANEHLTVYRAHEIRIVGVFDPSPEATARATALGLHTYDDLDALLADDAVTLVDVATPAAVRPAIVARALDAGKHVLAQKPFALDVDVAAALVDRAQRAGLTLAVNVNARWAAGWRMAGRLVREGRIGEVRAVSHVVELDLGAQAGGPLDATGDFAIVDVLTHWIDITGTWIPWTWPVRVQAQEHRLPAQPEASISAFGAIVTFVTAAGVSVSIQLVGANALAQPRWTAWVHGVDGTIRTRSRWAGPDELWLDAPDGTMTATSADQGWVPHGFEGSILEALHAAASGEPAENAVRSHLPMLAVVLAAGRSARAGGVPETVDEPRLQS